ncbi:hypothetical protein ONZ45_g2442 [Pleurotus djamor]|nr:hypothetical protein ONZ45_g2442 [Pleurotus djamor]
MVQFAELTMRPAFIVFALIAVVVARPLQATNESELETFNDLKQSGELDSVIEKAFQQWIAETDDLDFKMPSVLKTAGKKLTTAGKSIGKAGKSAAKSLAPHAKDIGKHVGKELKAGAKDLASHAISSGVAHIKGKIDQKLAGGEAPADASEASADAPADEPTEAPAERRDVDVLDEAVEQAIQEWLGRQNDTSIAALVEGGLKMKGSLNELD